ncbi:epimerase [Anaerocolumna cellulosilytica]|uniref:Epimerase n=1 Tax=Anaerocolumna cellulosilytica TaxID=433286 RepID=A0A6S6R0K2_9FIRM|nr:NAD-dependent epimerase/dehydratase family protein [Anaerocolumna cellulosilytica]MBB5193937.1 nucleoside-diphosphate-sugar epimerase [Anaerocolumna cellulosilytica]BCJ94849.1 epimerase [Anaerocolumna cellulosilytica]
MILVTGCTGYLGSRLVTQLLNEGKKVRGLTLRSEYQKAEILKEKGMEVFIGDLLIPETLKGIGKDVKIVYHMAGLHSSVDKMERLYVNGTEALIDSIKASNLEAFIMASNGAVYGDCGDTLLEETYCVEPEHPFGKITMKAEKLLLKRFRDSMFPSVILRIGEVYGTDEYNPFKTVNSRLKILGNGSNYISKVFCDDVIKILVLAPGKLKVGEIYNIVDDLPIKQQLYYEEICQLTNIPLPKWVPLDSVDERIRTSIHGLKALSLRMSNRYLKSTLNYKFLFESYDKGLRYLFNKFNNIE